MTTDLVSDGQPLETPYAAAAPLYATQAPTWGRYAGAMAEDTSTALSLTRAGIRGQYAGASWWDRSVAGLATTGYAELGITPPDPIQSPTITAEDANRRFAPPGTTITDKPLPEAVARLYGEAKYKELERASVIQRYAASASLPNQLLTGAAAALLDPFNLSTGFLPGVGEEAILSRLVGAGLGRDVFARTIARSAAGATAGAAAQGPLAFFKYETGTEEGSDYDARSAFRDMMFGAALGASIHAGLGALGDVYAPRGVPGSENAGIERAQQSNTFTGQARGAGSRVGKTQPKGTPVGKLFANFADNLKAPAEVQDKFRQDMFRRANKNPAQFGKDDVATTTLPFGDGLKAQVDAAQSGYTRVQVLDGDTVVAAARIEKGMIDSIAVKGEAKGQGIGENLLRLLDQQGIANIHEVPDRSPGFVAIQKKVLSTPASAAAPAAGDTVRLYRAEGAARPEVADWIKQNQDASGATAASGRWFTQDPEALDWYLKDIPPENKPRIVAVDVPKADLEKYRVSNNPEAAKFSRDPENEFFVPREIAEGRREVLNADAATKAAAAKAATSQILDGRPVDVEPVFDAKPPKRPQDIIDYLMAEGISPEDEGGWLVKMGLNKPNKGKFGTLVRADGLHIDKARESAEQAYFLPPNSDVNDLIDAVHETMKGNPRFNENDPDVAAWREWEENERRGPSDDAREQSRLYEDGYTTGMPQPEYDEARDAIYGENDEGRPERKPGEDDIDINLLLGDSDAMAKAAEGEAGEAAPVKTQIQNLLRRAFGEAADAADLAALDETGDLKRALDALDDADLTEDALEQAGQCLTEGGM